MQLVEDSSVWNAFVRASLQGTIFSQTHLLEAIETKYACFFVVHKGKTVAGIVLALDESGAPRRMPFYLYTYQGILYDQSVSRLPNHRRIQFQLGISEYILEELSGRYGKASFFLSYAHEDARAISWFHYHEPEKGQFDMAISYTSLLRFAGCTFDEYLLSIRKVRRQEYQYAIERHGIVVTENGDINALDRLHRLTFERQKLDREEEETKQMVQIARDGVQKGYARLLFAKKDGELVGANLFLLDARRGYYLIGANDPAYRKTGASTYLLLEQIQYCMETGRKEVDFVGVNSPRRGDYKMSFNGDIVPYIEAHFGF